MADSAVKSLTPSDIIGAVKQGLGELHQYLSQPLMEINPAICIPHMERMTDFLKDLAAMQGPMRQAEAGNQAQARKN